MRKPLPMLKGRVFGQPFAIPMKPELRKRILDLKNVLGVDHQEWARQVLEDELPKAEAEAKEKATKKLETA